MSRFQTIALVVCLVGSSASLADTPEIEFTEARYQVLADEQRFDGVVEAVYKSTLSAQTAGEVIELPFDVNDYVPKGAVVLRLDDAKQKARLDKATASEAQSRAVLAEAESSHQRNKRLIKDNAVSRSQLDKSEANLKSARAQLELSQAAAKEAREQWEYTVVHAPFAGVMVERFVEVGEHVQIGAQLGTGLSLEKLRVQVQVPAHYAQRIRATSRSRVQLPDSAQWLESEDVTLFPFADPDSHSFTLRVQLPPGQHDLFPGMLVKVAFEVGEKQHLVVPSEAIVYRSEVSGIYVLDKSGKLSFRQLLTGRDVPDGLTEVLAGLQTGERVALDPVAAAIVLKQQGSGHE